MNCFENTLWIALRKKVKWCSREKLSRDYLKKITLKSFLRRNFNSKEESSISLQEKKSKIKCPKVFKTYKTSCLLIGYKYLTTEIFYFFTIKCKYNIFNDYWFLIPSPIFVCKFANLKIKARNRYFNYFINFKCLWQFSSHWFKQIFYIICLFSLTYI